MQSRLHHETMSRRAKSNTAEIFIDRVKEALNLARDEDFAARFNVGKSTIATWRRRGSIPHRRYSEIAQISGIQYLDIIREHFIVSSQIMEICRISYLNAISKLFNAADQSELNELAFKLAGKEDEITHIIYGKIKELVGDDPSLESIVSLVRRAYEGDFLSPAEVREVLVSQAAKVPQKVPQSRIAK